MKFQNILFLLFLLFFLANNSAMHAQDDSTIVADTLASIDDSANVVLNIDSLKTPVPFFVNFLDSSNFVFIGAFKKQKKEIDFTDYRYTGNVLSELPFGFLQDLGSLGAPSEPNIFNFGFGNISLEIDGVSKINKWNSSFDLNNVQTESINSLEIIPIHKAFTYGIESNYSAMIINSQDTIKSKPISRIRYYQAPNEEGFIDAFFSARVLPKLVSSLRVSNSSIDKNFDNSEFGAWKVDFKSIYKWDDSLLTKLNYTHTKLNTQLNGGIDINSFDSSTIDKLNFYSIEYPVVFENASQTLTENSIGASLYGNILPLGYTNFSLSYINNESRYKNLIDTLEVDNKNKYSQISASIDYNFTIENFSAYFSSNYEVIDYDIESIDFIEQRSNYSLALDLKYNLLDTLFTPSVFGKYSKYNLQNTNGIGVDLKINVYNKLNFLIGYSRFVKPLSIIEQQSLSIDSEQNVNSIFASLEYSNKNIKSSLSYFNLNINNLPLALLDESESNISKIVYSSLDEQKMSGFNVNSHIQLWNILSTINMNYYTTNNDIIESEDDIFTVKAGLFYVDTLYNDNLNLKTGFIFYLFDNPNHRVYDFQNMQSAGYSVANSVISKLQLRSVVNDKLRLDFYLAGRIQDSATFYFIYENLLGNNYYVVPYFPMPESGMRIGISWDFLD